MLVCTLPEKYLQRWTLWAKGITGERRLTVTLTCSGCDKMAKTRTLEHEFPAVK
jgi:hypothetical protein